MKKNKAILMVAPYGFTDRMSGYIEFVAGRLLGKNNWQVFALARREKNAKTASSAYGIKIYRYKNLAQGLFFLLKILIAGRPAIVHVHNLRNNRLGFLAAMAAKLTFKTLLFTEYGLLHDHYLVSDRDDPLGKPLNADGLIFSLSQLMAKSFIEKTAPFKENIKNYLFHWALTHADKIVFVSKHNLPLAQRLGLKNYLYLPQIMDDARWNGQETEERPDDNSLKALNKISRLNNSPFCLFIGQIKLRKGWDVYLKAAALTDKAAMPYFVVISSSFNQPPEHFSQLVDDLKINQRIIYLGKVDGVTLKKIYGLSSIIVVPSRYEGFGLIAAEAFENKKPLIASAVPALTETVVDGANGLLVPARDPEKLAQAINRLARDPELAEKLVRQGALTIERLKSNELKNQWLDFYNGLIAKLN